MFASAPLPPGSLPQPTGFRSDPRFARGDAPPPAAAEILPEESTADPVTAAFSEGYAAGVAQARREAAELIAHEDLTREALTLALARIDTALAEALATRLRETVAALCEATLAPLALDPQALAARAERAAAMIAQTDEALTIHLHPDDLALVAPGLGGGWTLAADPALERGALRVESPAGGVEDGPAQWRRAIAEALGQC